jgi:hypothetical protein
VTFLVILELFGWVTCSVQLGFENQCGYKILRGCSFVDTRTTCNSLSLDCESQPFYIIVMKLYKSGFSPTIDLPLILLGVASFLVVVFFVGNN